jgi:hypothetical protein
MILGCEGDNLPFRTSGDLHERASDWLAPRFASTIKSFTQLDNVGFDTVRAIRNVIAHRTDRAVRDMNAALSAKKLPPELQRAAALPGRPVRTTAKRTTTYKVTANGVGAYLNADIGNGMTRCDAYFNLLDGIAQRF